MTVLIIGTEDDQPSIWVRDKILSRNVPVVLFDTIRFPIQTRLSFDPDGRSHGMFQATPQDPRIPLSEIRSVYRRWSKGIYAPQEPDPVLNEIVYWNIDSALGSFCRCLDAFWANSWEATEMHKYKGYQLKLLQEAGVRVPKTLITNDPEELVAFYNALDRQVIYKPVRGWAHTSQLTDADLTPERLETLSRTPVKLQELIPGRDIRAYVIGEDVFAMEIQAETLDFRETLSAPRIPVTLPDNVVADCLLLARTLDLVFTAIDLRRTPDGEYVFFEGNPTPAFPFDEESSGFPISDRLVEMLLSYH